LFGASRKIQFFETLNSFINNKDKTIMSDLLKQAIADAKAVRATALANAKAALEEAFTPKIQSMLAEKLRTELGEEQPLPVAGDDQFAPEAPVGDDGAGVPPMDPNAPLGGDGAMPQSDPTGDLGGAQVPPVPPAAPVGDFGGVPPPAPAFPGEQSDEEATEEDLEEELLGQDNSDPVSMTTNLTETEKASSDYKKTTSGHKTDDPGKKMVKPVGTAISNTKGSLGSGPSTPKASSDYKKMPSGNQVKNIKPSGTEDPQGASNELSGGPKKGETNATGKTLEENEIDTSSLDEILKELEDSVNDTNAEPTLDPACATPAPATGSMDEEINLESLLESDDDDEDDDKEEKGEKKDEKDDDDSGKPAWLKENISLKKELEEYRNTVVYLRDRINEVNLLNAKLLYTNKLFKQANMTNEQKLKIIESFDLTKSVREAKLVYATLAESINSGARRAETKKLVSGTVKTITEGLASKSVASTKPTKPVVLTEGAEMANRFKKLAGIR
jgi:hypothetical protein